jgi:hypothetical protein
MQKFANALLHRTPPFEVLCFAARRSERRQSSIAAQLARALITITRRDQTTVYGTVHRAMAALINPASTHVIRSGITNLSKNRDLRGVALKHECVIAEFVSPVRTCSKKIIGTSNKCARYSCARLQPRAQWTEGGNLASAVGNTSVTSSSRHHDHDAAKLLCIEEDVELVHGGPRCRISVLSAVSKSADPMLIIDAVGAVLGDQVQEGFMTSLSESLDLNEARPQPIPVGGFNSGVREQLSAVEMVTANVQVMAPPKYHPKLVWFAKSEEEENKYLDRAINATLAGAALSFAFTKLVTVDHDYWHVSVSAILQL